jgi:hypothetical protein
MTVAFTDSHYRDFQYELNDGELVNDVLCIVGEPDAEVLVRGYDTGSIAKYGRRSLRIDNPIVANVLADYATPKAQITTILDRGIEPYATVQTEVIASTDTMTTILLELEISDLVTVTESICGLSSVYFIIENIDLQIDPTGYMYASIGMVQARAGEHP